MEQLPIELLEKIINDVGYYWSTRLINRYFSKLVDNVQINKGISIIITRDMMKNYKQYFDENNKILNYAIMSPINTSNGIIYDLSQFQIVKQSGIYNIKLKSINKCRALSDMNNPFSNYYYYYKDFLNSSNIKGQSVFLPSTDIIIYFVKTHRLATNPIFISNTVKNTLNWYIGNIKNTLIYRKENSRKSFNWHIKHIKNAEYDTSLVEEYTKYILDCS